MFLENIKKRNRDDKHFPASLRTIPDPPKCLYMAGSLPQEAPMIAIVGTRRPTAYGKTVAERLAGELAKLGCVIVSGLALGIDSIAHRATLAAGGRTVAILPGSLDEIYPSSHQQLAQQIIKQGGAVMSEQDPGAPIYKHTFLARNRLVAGLSDGLLIIEAAERSGTMSTVASALDQGKPVMAVPGNINSSLSAGTNTMLKQGALPVTSVDDVLFGLGLTATPKQLPLSAQLGKQERQVIEQISMGANQAEALTEKLNLPPAELNNLLTMLELAGWIRCYEGNWVIV